MSEALYSTIPAYLYKTTKSNYKRRRYGNELINKEVEK